MHRLSNQLRALVAQSSQFSNSSHSLRSCLRLLHHQPLRTVAPNVKWSLSNSLLNSSSSSLIKSVDFKQFSFPLPLVHVRHVSSRERRKRKKPMTPITSKVKKIKIKSYSSYKLRFRTMNDGSIRRWREGKNHNAHEKHVEALWCIGMMNEKNNPDILHFEVKDPGSVKPPENIQCDAVNLG